MNLANNLIFFVKYFSLNLPEILNTAQNFYVSDEVSETP